jgi:hypothetical protein
MEIGKGIIVDMNDGEVYLTALEGKLKLSVQLGVIIAPALDKFKADVEAGKVDPVKGTDLDKEALLKAIEYIKAELS